MYRCIWEDRKCIGLLTCPTRKRQTSSLAQLVQIVHPDTHDAIFYLVDRLNPIWTVDTGSLFLLEMTSEKFFCSGDGLVFSIYDFDVLGQDDLLGRVFVTQEELLEGSGLRVEKPLILEKKHKNARGAKLVLRFRQATSNDVRFMKTLVSHQKKKVVAGAFADEAFVPVRQTKGTGGFLKRETRKLKSGVREVRLMNISRLCR
jgi:hypothetical protein